MRIIPNNYVPVVASASLMFIAIIWGSSYLVVKDLLNNVPPFAYLTIRYLISLPLVFILFRREITTWLGRNGNRRALLENLHPGFWLGTAFALQAFGLRDMGPGKAALLTALVFLFVPVLEYASGEKSGLLRLVPIFILAFVGIIVLAQPWNYESTVPDILIILCAVAFAFQIFLTGNVIRRTHFAVVFVLQGLTVFLLSFLIWVLIEVNIEIILSGADWIRIGYVALIVTAACYLIQFSAQRYVRARYVGLIFALEPVSALFLSASLGYESISLSSFIGSALILTSITLAIVNSSKDLNENK